MMRNSVFVRILRGIAALALAGALCFAAALGALYWAVTHVPATDGTSRAIIVLGAQVKADGEPSVQLSLRLEAALAEYEKHPRTIVVCGAQGSDEPRPEGDVMRDWLLERGVPADDVLAEMDSRNTRQNLDNAAALLAPETSVTVVTSDYHLPRALAMARDTGLDADGVGSPCRPEYWMKNHCRELLSWGKYLLEKAMGQ